MGELFVSSDIGKPGGDHSCVQFWRRTESGTPLLVEEITTPDHELARILERAVRRSVDTATARESLRDVTIQRLRCSRHGAECLAINDTRVTLGKCCGSWELVKTYSADLLAARPIPVLHDMLCALDDVGGGA